MWGGGLPHTSWQQPEIFRKDYRKPRERTKKTVFWAKNRKQNLKNTKEEWKSINCHVLCLRFHGFSTSEVTEHATFWGAWINCSFLSVVHQRWVLQIKAFSCMVSASDMNRHTSFLFPYKSRSITVIRASYVHSSLCIQSLRSLSCDSLQPLPKLVFQTVRATASSFKLHYIIFIK